MYFEWAGRGEGSQNILKTLKGASRGNYSIVHVHRELAGGMKRPHRLLPEILQGDFLADENRQSKRKARMTANTVRAAPGDQWVDR